MEPTSARRIALVLATSTGGVGVHVQSLATRLVAAGWPVTVCAPASTLAVFSFGGVRTTVVPIRSAPGLEALAVPALRRATADAALVHAHGLRAGTAAALAGGWHRRRPLVVSWHNAVITGGARGVVLAAGERFVARSADINLAASADLAARVAALGGKVELVPVAAPRPKPRRSSAAVRADLALRADQLLVVSVGRLHRQKAHDILIHAAAQWTVRDPAPLVVIAGDGPQRTELHTLIGATGAPVRLLGRRTDVADLLSAADVAVSTSRWEARPLAVQEAMALGAAVVATDVGGVAELVDDGAVLVPAGNVEALGAALERLLDNAGERAELGRRARQQASTWPDEDDTARACAAVYEELLG